ncbi:MAG: DHH family phosphoesterase [Faecalimonas sp.]|nr:DHH family phosphoesterase [Faecalimonas sp.]
MRNDVKFKGRMKFYLLWPVLMAVLLVIATACIFAIDRNAGYVMVLFLLVYLVAALILYFYNQSLIATKLVDFSAQYGLMQNVLLMDSSVPYAVMLEDGKIVWRNDSFQAVFGEAEVQESYLSNYIPELNRSIFPKAEGDKVEREFIYGEREYHAEFRRVTLKANRDMDSAFQLPVGRDSFVAVALTDVTELRFYMRENESQRLVSGLIYIDNYEEVMESVEEVRQSLLVALIDRKINQYMSNRDGIIKKLEKDKYFFVVKKKYFTEMEKDKFSVLEDAKTVSIGNTMPVTLSIGIGIAAGTYAQSYNYARVAIDLALARGGDQAVVKNGGSISYYGGKREQTTPNTRVKARVKAEALREFIMAKDKVIVMGHRIADVDSFGAAIGIWRAAVTMEKKAHIVLNDITVSVRPLYNSFCENPAYPKDMFVKSSEAQDLVTDNTMVIVVDTSKPEITDCPELLKKAKTIVVFDHHRQGSYGIENTVLSYIEPYSSSACEMVAEVLQYITDDVRITGLEANSMYAGMMIDTNNFMNRTGVRTFEAAAFLRRCGADITRVRKMFRDDMESYRVKAEIIGSAEVFQKQYAIAQCTNTEIDSPTIIGAQAANELLDIRGIKASFVLTEYYGKIYLSARSIDEVNVQVITERLGGGGHMNSAGAQFQHTDMEEAIATLKEVIEKMIKEGDL